MQYIPCTYAYSVCMYRSSRWTRIYIYNTNTYVPCTYSILYSIHSIHKYHLFYTNICTYNTEYIFFLPCTTFHALSLWPVPTVVRVACSWSRFSGTKPKTGFHHALKLPLMRAALEMHLRILSTSLSACVPSPDLPLPHSTYRPIWRLSVCMSLPLKHSLSVSLPLPLCCLSVTLTISPHSYSPHSCTHSVSRVPLPLLPWLIARACCSLPLPHPCDYFELESIEIRKSNKADKSNKLAPQQAPSKQRASITASPPSTFPAFPRRSPSLSVSPIAISSQIRPRNDEQCDLISPLCACTLPHPPS